MGDLDRALNSASRNAETQRRREDIERQTKAKERLALLGPIHDRITGWLNDLCVQFASTAKVRGIPTIVRDRDRIWTVVVHEELRSERIGVAVYSNGFWCWLAGRCQTPEVGPNYWSDEFYDRATVRRTLANFPESDQVTHWMAGGTRSAYRSRRET